MTGYDGKGRGFGFVSYEEPEAAEKVGTLYNWLLCHDATLLFIALFMLYI